MERKDLVEFIGSALEVEILPITHSVLIDKIKEYEKEYIHKNIKSYQVGRMISEDDLETYAKIICDMYGITLEQFKGKGRYFNLVMARVHFCRYMRLEHNATFTSLARYLNRDHTSVLHYVKRYKLHHDIPPHSRFIND